MRIIKKSIFTLFLGVLIGCTAGIFVACDKDDADVSDGNSSSSHTHNYSTQVTPPTCIAQGYTLHSCSCGDSYKDDYENALGHSFTAYVSNGDATYDSDGTETATCGRNGCNAEDTRTDVGSMLLHTHNYSTQVILPACTTQGYTVYTCACGDSYNADYENALGHSFTTYVSNGDATYDGDGTETATCGRNDCNETHTRTDEGSMLSYFSFTEYGDGYALQRYTGDNEAVEVPATYKGKNVIAIGVLPTTTTIDDLYISGDGFYENTTVKEITLPNTIKVINTGAFAYSSVRAINIPSSCRAVYNYAFLSCSNLAEVTFEGSIFTEPFDGCNVTDIVVKDTATYTDGVFSEFDNLQRLTVDSLNTTAKALFKTELGETIPGSTSYATATITNHNDMYPESASPRSFTVNGTQHNINVPVDYCNWYYDYSTKVINGVTMTYDGEPGVVNSWGNETVYLDGFAVTTYKKPLSATFTFYISTDDEHTGDTYFMPTNFEKLTITSQLFSANDAKVANCPFEIEYEKYPISAIEVVGETSFYPDDFDYADYQIKIIRADNSYEFMPLRQEYLSAADQNLLKTSGEHTLTVTYNGVACDLNVDILFYDFEGYVFDSKDFKYDGTEKSLEVANLPDGASVTYHNNGQTEVGEYTVTATLTKQNYNEKTITATLRICELAYSINYVMGRENVVNSNPDVYNYGETLELSTPVCNGYEFLGWYLDSNFTQSITQITAGEYGNKTLYAKWQSYFVMSGSTLTRLTAYGKTLTNIVVPSVFDGVTITAISQGAFKGCSSLESIELPFVGGSKSATESSSSTLFGYIFGTSSYTGSNMTTQYYLYNHPNKGAISASIIYYIPASLKNVVITGEHIFYGAFYNCGNLTSITISDSVTSIGGYAFDGCSSLTKVNYTGTIDEWAMINFSEYTSNPIFYAKKLYINDVEVTEVVLSKATEIAKYAFFNCSSLTSITIGNSVTSIGYKTFYNCTGLIEINFNATLMNDLSSYNDVFAYAGQSASGITVNIGANATNIPAHLFNPYVGSYAPKITNVIFEENSVCKNIGEYAFYGCSSLTKIVISDSVTSIDTYAFYGCSGLKSIVIPDSVTSIGSYAFYGCSGLKSIDIPDSVTSIGSYAFAYCSSLKSIDIPDSVTSIGSSAFRDCSSLTNVVIGESVTTIGWYVFYRCSSLTSVIFEDTTTWYHTSNSGYTGGSQISVANSSNNATYLRSTYYSYYWYKE